MKHGDGAKRSMRVLILVVLAMAPMGAATHVDSTEIRWACGGGGGHPDHCGIDPVGGGEAVESMGTPRFGDAWIKDGEVVLGVVIDGEARAYPVKMLSRHEVVNDDFSGTAVAVTYCPLCGSGVSFLRDVAIGGTTRTLTFTASGYLFQNDLVMWDPETGTLWNQILGRPVGTLSDGEVLAHHLDARLTVVPTEVVAWGAFKDAYPDATMLQPVVASYNDPYETYYQSCRIGTSSHACDIEGLHPKEQVYGIDVGERVVAFPFSAVGAAGGIALDDMHALLVSLTPSGRITAFDTKGHVFTRDESGLAFDADGDAWDLSRGQRIDGGASLPTVTGTTMFWFAWHEHHPTTAVWEAENATGPLKVDDGKLPGFTIINVLIFAAFVAILWRVWRVKRS